MRTEVLIILLIEGIFCNDTRKRLITMLRTNQKFHDQWIHLIELQVSPFQHRQAHEQGLGATLETLTDLVLQCAPNSGTQPDHVDYVRPGDIQLYAELGQLTRYCDDSILELIKGKLDSCQHASYTNTLPSIDKFLKKFNRNLTIIESSDETKLENQTEHLVEKFLRHKRWRNKWKLIVILPSMEDGEPKEPEQAAVEVMKTIKQLYEVVPQRTILIVLRSSTLQLWQDASNAHRACRTLLEPWKLYETLNPVSVWDQVEKICELHFQSSLFTVQILPLMKDASLSFLPGTNQMDLSLLGHDCVHFSPRGLSLLHIATWNAMLTRCPDRAQSFNLSLERPLCADPQCPFIRTSRNSALCVWKRSEVEGDSRRWEQLIAISVLTVAIVLFVVIIGVICCLRKRRDRVDEVVENFPRKPPVGADWTSWKYIDEDSSSSYIS